MHSGNQIKTHDVDAYLPDGVIFILDCRFKLDTEINN